MKKLKPYYAIAGKNGYGICRSWEDCERCMEYFIGMTHIHGLKMNLL